jgi:GT2 family glycosyltransferase
MHESLPPKRRRSGAARLYDQEEPEPAAAGPDELPEGEAPPPVVAVVVTSGGPGLEGTLASLRDQEYPQLSVLVIDDGAPTDPTPRIAAILPTAYVRRRPQRGGFAAAANDALNTVEGAPFLLFCRDTVALDPTAVRDLVEEAYRSNAGIAGPKIVDMDQPEVLLQVGLAIDKFGATYSGIEPGEIDQEQHDAVRDVFYVSTAALLIRADLFATLHGFDAEMGDDGEDLDLCWRARVAGARVLVVPDARVRQPARDLLLNDDGRRRENRNRARTLLKAYSATSLLRVLPQALLVTLFEALVLLALTRRAQARAVVDAWTWNLRRLSAIRRARSATQAVRAVTDADIRFLQVSGSARARDFVLGRIEHGGRARSLMRTSRDFVDATTERIRLARVAMWIVLIGLPLLGVRDLIMGRVPAIGSMLRWPAVPTLLRDFTSSWRFSGLGSAVPAPPGFAVLAGAGITGLGAVGFARTAVVAAALPAGIIGTYRLARYHALDTVPAAAAALAYAANPVARNALANGRFGPLMLVAAAPFVVRRVLAGGNPGGWRSRALPLAVLTGLLAALYPPALVVGPVAAVGLLAAAPATGGWRPAGRALASAVIAAVIAFVLLLPWSLSLVLPGSDPASAELAFRPRLGAGALLRFHTGPAGAGALSLSLVIAAALALIVTGRARLAIAVRGWTLAATGFVLAFVSCQRWAGGPWPAPEAPLVLAALGLALAIGAGAGAFLHELPRSSFGWRHAAVVVAGAGLLIAGSGFAGASLDGRYGLPARDWASSLSWMDTAAGEFRVLWAGDPAVLPLVPWTLPDGTGYGLSRDGAPDARVLWPISADGTTGLVGDALRDALADRTDRLGHLLAPMAVRYVAVPLRRAPGAHGPRAERPALERALAGQLDLAELTIDRDLVLYENRAWFPAGALATPSNAGTESALTAELADSARALHRRGWRGASGSAPSRGTLLWAETYDRSWRATIRGHALPHRKAFGWANGFTVPRGGRVTVRHSGVLLHLAGVGFSAALWFFALRWWRRDRRAARAAATPPSIGTASSETASTHDDPVPVAVVLPPSPLDLPLAPGELAPEGFPQ